MLNATNAGAPSSGSIWPEVVSIWPTVVVIASAMAAVAGLVTAFGWMGLASALPIGLMAFYILWDSNKGDQQPAKGTEQSAATEPPKEESVPAAEAAPGPVISSWGEIDAKAAELQQDIVTISRELAGVIAHNLHRKAAINSGHAARNLGERNPEVLQSMPKGETLIHKSSMNKGQQVFEIACLDHRLGRRRYLLMKQAEDERCKAKIVSEQDVKKVLYAFFPEVVQVQLNQAADAACREAVALARG